MINIIEKLETLQKQFLALSEPSLVKIGNEPLPPDFPADLAHILPIIESGPWHYAGNPDELKDGFLLHADTAARLAGYRGEQPVTSWLDRICPSGEKSDLRQASANECQRLLNSLFACQEVPPGGRSLIARNIFSLRHRCGLTQEGLAEHVKASQATVYKHEAGRDQPGAYMLRQYATLFSRELSYDVTVEDLVTRDLTGPLKYAKESYLGPTVCRTIGSNLETSTNSQGVTADLHEATESHLSERRRYRAAAQLQGLGATHRGVRGDSSSAKNSREGTAVDPNGKTHSVPSKGRE